MARRAGHVEEDDVLGLRWKRWLAGTHGVGRIDDGELFGLQLSHHGIDGDGAQADSTVAKEMAAGALGEPAVFEVIHELLAGDEVVGV